MKTQYTEAQKEALQSYWQAKQNAENQIAALLRRHSLKYRNGSIIDHGKPLYMVPKEINEQIKAIRQSIVKPTF